LHSWLEQSLGAALFLFILVDVFLTVLYARMGSGILSDRVARLIWRVFRGFAKPLAPTTAAKFFSFCGPLILVIVLLVWALSLTLGMALIIHPKLGTAIVAASGPTPSDFATALYASGGSISIVGGSNFEPDTAGYRLLFLVNSLVGMSVISLTVTYLLQVYNALYRRNATGFSLHLGSAETGDAAELVVGLVPEGHISGGYTNLSEMANQMAGLKESHHFYPVLFYFRFPEPHYAVSRMALLTLDTVSLIKSGLDDGKYAWLKESIALTQLWRGSLDTIVGLAEAFLPEALPQRANEPDAPTRERWRRRYFSAVRRLRQAGIQTVSDEQEGASAYVRLRTCWNTPIETLGGALGYTIDQIDVTALRPEVSAERAPVEARLRSAG
jgi:hypothetical protein